jgi:nicotinate-nucleotide--dimethylbenzimidazole phosphoribosyltransferase
MSVNRSLIAATANPLLQQALAERLSRRHLLAGSHGELEPLALRLGLMQSSLKPRLRSPQLVVFAADHGLAVDGFSGQRPWQTHERVRQLLGGQLPLAAFARSQGIALTVIDAGIAEDLPPHSRLLMRKIAHGTRNARVGPAMALDQAHAAIRAGMEIGQALSGNAALFAGLGVGSAESAALLLARLGDTPIDDLLDAGEQQDPEHLTHLLLVAERTLERHGGIDEPVEMLAAFGGFEIAMMAGAMLVAASRRHLLLIDGLAACAALMLASRIAEAVTDYCVFCRSHSHRGLDAAIGLFGASAMLELGQETMDGTGALLAWPLVRSAASLLTDVLDSAAAVTPPTG